MQTFETEWRKICRHCCSDSCTWPVIISYLEFPACTSWQSQEGGWQEHLWTCQYQFWLDPRPLQPPLFPLLVGSVSRNLCLTHTWCWIRLFLSWCSYGLCRWPREPLPRGPELQVWWWGGGKTDSWAGELASWLLFKPGWLLETGAEGGGIYVGGNKGGSSFSLGCNAGCCIELGSSRCSRRLRLCN